MRAWFNDEVILDYWLGLIVLWTYFWRLIKFSFVPVFHFHFEPWDLSG